MALLKASYTHFSCCLCAGLAFFAAACTHTPTPQQPAPCVVEASPAQVADYFLMEPTRLTKGHIFLRRSPVEEKTAQNMVKTTTQNTIHLPLTEEALTPAQITPPRSEPTPKPALPYKGNWKDIRKAQINIHAEDETFQNLIETTIATTAPIAGPWRVQWKMRRENRNILSERFSLNTETTFDRFATSVAAFMLNHRGVELNFELFDSQRVLVISDVFTN